MRTAKVRHGLHGVDNIQHGETAAIAAIQRLTVATAAQILERRKMRAHKIAYMDDVVADAGPVGRRVIGAKNFQMRAFA
jgi:predicted thioesterase